MHSIAIVHQGALGDSLLLIPLFRSLRERFPGCSITMVTRTNLGQMLMMMGIVEAYVSADDQSHTRWFAELDGSVSSQSLPQPPWALADILISAVSSGSDAWAAHAKLARAGEYSNADRLLFFEPRPPADYPGHITKWHREQLKVLDLTPPPRTLPRHNPDGAVLIHPGAGGDAKCWPRERFLSLGRTLKRNGILPTFILGEAEQERWTHAYVNSLKEEFPWYLHMGLYELAEKMSRARLYLGNDSGVTHLAAAMGVPVIALFGPSNDTQWAPMGPQVRVVRAEAPHQKSLEHLEESEVLAAMMAELRKINLEP